MAWFIAFTRPLRRSIKKPAKILPFDNPKIDHGVLVMLQKTDLLISRVVGFSFVMFV
jgi:mannitol-specific phosphotransferase system IIBC component